MFFELLTSWRSFNGSPQGKDRIRFFNIRQPYPALEKADAFIVALVLVKHFPLVPGHTTSFRFVSMLPVLGDSFSFKGMLKKAWPEPRRRATGGVLSLRRSGFAQAGYQFPAFVQTDVSLFATFALTDYGYAPCITMVAAFPA